MRFYFFFLAGRTFIVPHEEGLKEIVGIRRGRSSARLLLNFLFLPQPPQCVESTNGSYFANAVCWKRRRPVLTGRSALRNVLVQLRGSSSTTSHRTTKAIVTTTRIIVLQGSGRLGGRCNASVQAKMCILPNRGSLSF